jgi:hypothetical protein
MVTSSNGVGIIFVLVHLNRPVRDEANSSSIVCQYVQK